MQARPLVKVTNGSQYNRLAQREFRMRARCNLEAYVTDHPLRPETERTSQESRTGSKGTDLGTVGRNRAATTSKCGIKTRKRGSQGPDLRSNQHLTTRPNA